MPAPGSSANDMLTKNIGKGTVVFEKKTFAVHTYIDFDMIWRGIGICVVMGSGFVFRKELY